MLIIRCRHTNTQSFCFVGAGNNAPIIIAEDNDRLVPEVGLKHSLAGAIKAIAINNGLHSWCIEYITTPHTAKSLNSARLIDLYRSFSAIRNAEEKLLRNLRTSNSPF